MITDCMQLLQHAATSARSMPSQHSGAAVSRLEEEACADEQLVHSNHFDPHRLPVPKDDVGKADQTLNCC